MDPATTGNPDFWTGAVGFASALIIAVSFELLPMMRREDPDLPRVAVVTIALLLPLFCAALSLLALAWRWDAPVSEAVVAGVVGVPLIELFLLVALATMTKARGKHDEHDEHD
jgi:hypothetical protein